MPSPSSSRTCTGSVGCTLSASSLIGSECVLCPESTAGVPTSSSHRLIHSRRTSPSLWPPPSSLSSCHSSLSNPSSPSSLTRWTRSYSRSSWMSLSHSRASHAPTTSRSSARTCRSMPSLPRPAPPRLKTSPSEPKRQSIVLLRSPLQTVVYTHTTKCKQINSFT